MEAILKQYALSNDDIQTILHPDTKIHTYKDLYNVRHFDELLDPLGRCILLYLTDSENSGHWVALIKRKNMIEFFDPYGFAPDTQGINLNSLDEVNEAVGQNNPRLLELIADAGYDLNYNTTRHQKMSDGVATCGRHSASRLIFHKLSTDEYKDLMNKLKSPEYKDADEIVVKLTDFIHEKN
jgi:hypothetical protein